MDIPSRQSEDIVHPTENGGCLEGMFEWKIENFEEKLNERKKSPIFKLGEDDCWLEIIEKDYRCTTCAFSCKVYLNTSTSKAFRYKILCNLCVIDVHGKTFLVTKRRELVSNKSYINLMAIRYDELQFKMKDLLPNDVLTLRLSWYEEDEWSVCEWDIRTPSHLNSGNNSPKFLEKLAKDLGTFYESRTLTDCVLKVGDDHFPVHRAVLAARSPVFEAMFRHDTSENRSGEVDIPETDAAVLSDVLHYVYSGQVHGLTTDTAVQMYTMADKYALIEMKDICLDFLMNNLTMENFCDASVLAHAHGESALEKKVIQFIVKKSEDLLQNETWKEFSKSIPSLAIKYLHTALVSVVKHETKK